MPLPPARDHSIPLSTAAAATKRYRDQAGAAPQRGGLFHRASVDAVLAQPGCVALRLYYARGDTGQQEVVLVGVDANGNDLSSGAVLDIMYPCPPFCSSANPLSP